MDITVTESCASRIKALQASEAKPDLMLRVIVDSGGCQGFEYIFELTEDQKDDDHIFDRDGTHVLVDDISMAYMKGSEIDYENDLIGAQFVVKNPNAQSSCGCGTSFSV